MAGGIASLNEGMGYIDLRMCIYAKFRQQTVLDSGCKLPLLFQLCLDSFKINIVAFLVPNCLTELKK